MKSRLIIHLLFVISSLFTYEFYSPAYGQSSCADWGSPLERKLINDDVNSPFNPDNDHYGTDYKAVDGDSVLAVADGEIDKIGSDFRQEINRLGLMGKGWGTYVVVKHKDGSTTLYAHLLKDSTNHLGVGMPVAKGTKIGEADSTGGASGPHLHIEYAPNGRWRDKSSLTNPHPCIIGCPETLSTITLAGPDAPSDGSQYTATGGTEPYTWSISKGSITQGGVVTISGQCGTATITATDSCVNQGTKDVRMPDGFWLYTGSTTRFYGGVDGTYCQWGFS